MTKLQEAQGYTLEQMRSSVLASLHQPMTQRNLAGLIRIFVPEVSPLWTKEIVLDTLYKNVRNCKDPYAIEEAARILIDFSYWYDDRTGRYMEYGADNNGW